jgi:hypothetical protein
VSSEYTDEIVRLAEIVSKEGTLNDCRFTRCQIYGPGVLWLDGTDNVIGNSGFGQTAPETIIWQSPPPTYTGAIKVTNCSFLQCAFLLIGFTGERDLLGAFRASFNR